MVSIRACAVKENLISETFTSFVAGLSGCTVKEGQGLPEDDLIVKIAEGCFEKLAFYPASPVGCSLKPCSLC